MILVLSATLLASSLPAQLKKGTLVNAKLVSPSEKLSYPASVNKFYNLVQTKTFWFSGDALSYQLRQQLVSVMDSAGNYGLDNSKYHLTFLKANIAFNTPVADSIAKVDKVFTDAAFALCRDVYAGNIDGYLSYDEVSPKYAEADANFLLTGLATIKTPGQLATFVESLEPQATPYKVLKNDLYAARKNNVTANIKRLTSAINYIRWINHFHFTKYILVNIASASMDYFEHDSSVLNMKVVVGKPSTKTPRFAVYCNQVVLYPYWNVPVSIGLNELLPQFKKAPSLVDGMNMQVVDGNGKVIDHHNINWAKYDKTNFPYSFRQSTGCDNALGVIKFNLTDPYNVYMHDTNNKFSFLANSRYYSHGCIRLEKPFELGNYLLSNRLDTSFLQSCLKDQKPTVLTVVEPVPVLVIYLVAIPNENNTVLFKDIYRMFQ